MVSLRFVLNLAALLACLPVLALKADLTPDVSQVESPASILFVGNSFTFYNDSIYTHLRKLLVAENPANRRAIFLKSMTISGAVLADHRGGLQQMLGSRDWDIVVLQGHSRAAIEPERTAAFSSAIKLYSSAIRKAGAEPVLFMTWAYSDRRRMTRELASEFTRLGNEYDLMVVPVGLAFHQAIDEIPGVVLHNEDRIHPSLEGTYLAAAVFYVSLFGKSPVDLAYDAGLEPALAQRLREIAFQSTRDYFSLTLTGSSPQ